jgi:peptide chain release factor subunit 1
VIIRTKEENMFRETDLQELVEFRSTGEPVLSLYLNVEPGLRSTDAQRLVLKQLLKDVSDEAQEEDRQAVERYFELEYNWQGKGVAVFSCQNADFWRAYPLAVPVHDCAYALDRPYIKPLTDVLDAYGRYAVILVDQTGARMFLFNLGELVETGGMLGEDVKRQKHGRGSTSAGRRGGGGASARREDHVAFRNLKEAAEAAGDFVDSNHVTRLVLGGNEGTVAQFQDLLARPMQDKVIGTFVVDSAAPAREVQDRSMEVIEAAAWQREVELVDELIAGWKRRTGSAVGLADTLAALQEHRAHSLLVAVGYQEPGYRCSSCRYMTLGDRKTCPLCGAEMEAIEDIVDYALHRALEQNVEVEIIRGNEKLEDAGKIGALLRY